MRIPTRAEVEAEQGRRSFAKFVELAWPLLEPATPFVGGLHIAAICDTVEAFVNGELRRVIINLPPRCGKSTLICVLLPAWVWTFAPEKRWLYASYAQTLSTRDSRRCRALIESSWYRERWGHVFALASDANLVARFENDHTGVRIATSVGGAATGEGGDFIMIDDPHKSEEAESAAARTSVLDWYSRTVATRRNSLENGGILLVMQRFHEHDLSGHLLERGGWHHLCLPMEYEPDHPFVWPDDPRTEPGELLCEQRFGRVAVDEIKGDLGSYATAGQLQQRPSPAGGGLFKRPWWRYYPSLGHLPFLDELCQSWDLAFSDGAESDYVCGQLWGIAGVNKYLIKQTRERLSFTDTIAEVRAMTDWVDQNLPRRFSGHPVYVEKAANAYALENVLRDKIPSLILVWPQGSKISRAHLMTAQVEAGNIWLPGAANQQGTGYDPTLTQPWVEAFIHEFESFPRGAHDDQVDAATQAINRLGTGPRLRVLG